MPRYQNKYSAFYPGDSNKDETLKCFGLFGLLSSFFHGNNGDLQNCEEPEMSETVEGIVTLIKRRPEASEIYIDI